MKKICPIIACLAFASCTPTYHATVVASVNAPQDKEEMSYQVFYDELAPYGKWIEYPNEGYVFSPNVDQDFQPYATNGHWVYTDQGWTWASDYNWGWAAFHYGRWFYEDGYGWLWLPGHEWAPAWVKWGRSGDYYGWAPLGPNIAASQEWEPPQNSWNFVPAKHMNNPNVSQYVVNKSNNTTIVKNVTIINNTTVLNNRNVVTNTVNNNINNINNTTNNNTNNRITNNTNNVNNTSNTTTNNTTNNHNNNTVNPPNNHINDNASPSQTAANNNNNSTTSHVNNTNNNPALNNHETNNTTNSAINNHVTTNHIINSGPQVSEVQKAINVPIQKAVVVENNRAAQTRSVNNTLVIYRPLIKENNVGKGTGNIPVPQKIEPYKKK